MYKINPSSLRVQKIQFICLPYSGGSAFAFQPLMKHCPKSWEVITVAFPGRGQRIEEPLVYSMEALVEDTWQQIKDILEPPYVFFGHSLGSTLAYLLTHKAVEEGCPLPLHVLLSGTDGPSVPSEKPYRHLFSKKAFKNKLQSYGGISNEILNDADIFDFFEPIIRADFQAVETWQYTKKSLLNISATVITGTEEDMTEGEIRLWQKEFSTIVSFKKMKGNHFFLFKQPEQFMKIVQEAVNKSLI